jgi:hypothetical protein
MDISMEKKIVYTGWSWRIVQSALFGLLAFNILAYSFRTGSPRWIQFLLFLFVAVDRCLVYIPGAAFLKLDQEGFTACYWFRETRYRWSDIAEFKVITYRYGGIIPYRRRVGFRYTETSGKRNLAVRIVGALARFDQALPDSYGMKAMELAQLLSRWRLGNVVPEQCKTPWISSSWQTTEPRV